jgi:hypothetical protein
VEFYQFIKLGNDSTQKPFMGIFTIGICGESNQSLQIYILTLFLLEKRNRSQVQGSTFRVKDKESIKDPKSSLKMLISLNNCQFGSKFWIRPDEADAFLVNTHPKRSPAKRIQP